MDRDIQKRKTKLSPAFPPALEGKNPVNFVSFSTAFSRLMFTHEIDFLEDHISAPKGCCAPKFLHAPQNGQVLLAHTPQEMGVPFNNFFLNWGSKIGFKCSV